MNNNIVLPLKIIYFQNNNPEIKSIFLDPVFIISAITLLVTLAALCFSVIIFRPKVHIEIKNVLFKQLLCSYDLVITNNGNVMAEDIKIEFDDNLKNALNQNCLKKDEDSFGSFKFIESNLNKEFKYLPANKEVKGLFIITENNDKNTSPLLFDVPFTVYITYRNSITKWKYKKQPIVLELKKHDWITDAHISDNLDYNLKLLLDELKEISKTSENIATNVYEIAYNFECNKMQNVEKIFNSLNKKEKQIVLNILGIKNSDKEYLFIDNLKTYINESNNSLSKKLRKLKFDEYSIFMSILKKFRDDNEK